MYVSIKAFGDLVIAVSCLTGVRAGQRRPTILAGSHLNFLINSLAPDVPIRELSLASSAVPALFDAKAAGPRRALASLVELFSEIQRVTAPSDLLVFDSLGPRQNMVAAFRAKAAMPARDNIYLAYDASVSQYGFDPVARQVGRPEHGGGRIGIFPASRLASKFIPLTLLERIVEDASASGREIAIHLLEGERRDVHESGLPVIVWPRDFVALGKAVSSCDLVISADSLPAHLAENASLPSFVLGPEPNTYWLPASAYFNRRWSTFGDQDTLERVRRFTSL